MAGKKRRATRRRTLTISLPVETVEEWLANGRDLILHVRQENQRRKGSAASTHSK